MTGHRTASLGLAVLTVGVAVGCGAGSGSSVDQQHEQRIAAEATAYRVEPRCHWVSCDSIARTRLHSRREAVLIRWPMFFASPASQSRESLRRPLHIGWPIPFVSRVAVLSAATALVGAASGSNVAPPSLKGGQRVVFRAGVLRAGRIVACTRHGVRVVAHVPYPGQGAVTFGDGMKGSATLRLTARADGSVVASCR